MKPILRGMDFPAQAPRISNQISGILSEVAGVSGESPVLAAGVTLRRAASAGGALRE